MSILDQGGQYVEGSFTNQGYIFRTKHTPLQVKFGDFNVTFGVLTKQSDAFQLLKNNALDSITINATQPKIAENGSKTHLTSSNSNSTPNALSDEQKTNYAGCLSYTQQSKDGKDYTYSVSNLRYTGKNNYNDSPHVITLNDGTEVKDYSQAIATNLDTVLGTTDGGLITLFRVLYLLVLTTAQTAVSLTLRVTLISPLLQPSRRILLLLLTRHQLSIHLAQSLVQLLLGTAVTHSTTAVTTGTHLR